MSRRTWRREEIRGRRVRGYGFQGEHDHGAEGVVRRGRPEFFLRRRAREWGITRCGQVLTSFGSVCAAVRRAVPGYSELDGRALGARLYLIYIESARLPYHGQHLQAREEYSKDLHEILHRGRMRMCVCEGSHSCQKSSVWRRSVSKGYLGTFVSGLRATRATVAVSNLFICLSLLEHTAPSAQPTSLSRFVI